MPGKKKRTAEHSNIRTAEFRSEESQSQVCSSDFFGSNVRMFCGSLFLEDLVAADGRKSGRAPSRVQRPFGP
jgi:hypothetical protein